MATFLSLVQSLARESGTLSPDQISAVTGQTGRAAKMVEWVNDAWLRIQRHRPDWLWMRAETTKTISQGTARYTGAGSWALTRFANFIGDNEELLPVSLYETALGTDDEGVIPQVDYNYWYAKWARGSHDELRPTEYAISPSGEMCFGATPDDAYTVRFMYQKSPQTLSANSDTPELPDRFHNLIVWEARRLLLLHDGAYKEAAEEQPEIMRLYNELNQSQLPPIRLDVV